MATNGINTKRLSAETLQIDPGKVLDNNNAHIMVDTIIQAQAEGYRYLLVDLTRTEFLSSAGVGSILGTVEISRETGGDIILCNVPPTIMHVLEVLDLRDYLTIANTMEDAIAKCAVT